MPAGAYRGVLTLAPACFKREQNYGVMVIVLSLRLDWTHFAVADIMQLK